MLRPAVDYRKFRLHLLDTPRFRHLKLLLYWPVFYLLFWYAERHFPAVDYYSVRCALDALIPFEPWFVIPYLLWFPFVTWMLGYTLLYDVPAFRRMMRFIILTYSLALLTYFLFPNCQNLRPALSSGQDVLTSLVSVIYASDTNTNVFPSIHVLGSVAVYFAAADVRRLSKPCLRVVFYLLAALISASTVFLKQHSLLDVAAALVVCTLGYVLVYRLPSWRGLPTLRRRQGPFPSRPDLF